MLDGLHTHDLPEHEHEAAPHEHPVPEHEHPADKPPHIALTPDGNRDDAKLRIALARLPEGGAIELCAGTWVLQEPVDIDDDITLQGHGNATKLTPAPGFPAEQPLLRVYHNDSRPAAGVVLRDFRIQGIPGYPTPYHGIDFCACRSLMFHVRIERVNGDGLTLRHMENWHNYETKLIALRIGGSARYGIHCINSSDQHWLGCDVHDSAVSNVYGRVTGNMISNFHFYAGANNDRKQRTLRNVHLWGSSRTRFGNGKIEHAQEELVLLDGTQKAGSVTFTDVGFRNGSSAGAGLHPQLRVTRGGTNYWKLNLGICQFDADTMKPSWNVQIDEGAVRNSRATGCTFEDAAGDITPVSGLTVI